MAQQPTHAAPRTRKRRVWPWVLAPVLALAVWAGWLAWDGMRLMEEAQALDSGAARAQQALTDRDAAALSTTVDELAQSAQSFNAHSDGPHWWLAARTPWLGDQVRPLQAAGTAMGVLAEDALGPLAELDDLSALEAPPFEDGRIDPFFLEPFVPALESADAALASQNTALQAADADGAIAQVREPFERLRTEIDELSVVVADAYATAQVLPGMLGGEGPREYMVLMQNNAEPRALGGIVGAALEVTIDDGRFELGEYYTAGDLNVPDEEVTELTDDEYQIFTRRMSLYLQNVTFTPEFPRAAQVASAFWERERGSVPDGVIAVDPVALQYMMAGSDEREVDGLTISGDNLAQVLLNEIYLRYEDPNVQDAFFALAARELFGELVSGGAGVMDGAQRALDEERLLVWSANEAEQAVLDTTVAGGNILEQDETLGVFINDGSGSKIGYYVDATLEAERSMCGAGDQTTGGSAVLELTHTFDGDVNDLPGYVSGADAFVPAGEFHANVVIYPPSGTSVTNLALDGEQAQMRPVIHHGRPAANVRVEVLPGQTRTLAWELQSYEPSAQWTDATLTPGAKPTVNVAEVLESPEGC
ncbi:DUF4012 domain-containing protein [Demequina sp. SO4-13]|uniref:DUF4012 domain-containing protein n=1 Tax=Demequina sp. SO4-13 TaxID=3401027 RepID=UPI003AF5DA1F